MHESDFLDRIPLGIIIFDETNTMISINEWGSAFIDRTSTYLHKIIEDMVILTRAKQESIQKIVRCCDCNEFFIWSIKTEIIKSPSLRIAVIIQDKTAHTKLEQSILKAEKVSVIGYLAIGSLMEIRNPLTSAMGFCKLMLEGEKVNREYFEIVSKELNQIHEIIESYADISEPVATRCIESIYHKLWTFIHSKIRSYRLIMITDFRDDSRIGYTSEEQMGSLFRFVDSLDLWKEENIYVVNIGFRKQSRAMQWDFVLINSLNKMGRSGVLSKPINRYKIENHLINLLIINNEEADIDLNFDAI